MKGPCLKSSCYELIAEEMPFAEAVSHCTSLGGHIMDIHSELENVIGNKIAEGIKTKFSSETQ